MMPTEGKYTLRKITKQQFAAAVIAAVSAGQLNSLIGYPQNIEILREMTGCDIPLNRGQVNFQDGDTALIMRLSYRPGAHTKGQKVNPEDFEYFRAEYSK